MDPTDAEGDGVLMQLPSTIGWRKRDEDGMIVTWDLPQGSEVAPMLSEPLSNGLALVEEKYGDLCREIAEPLGVPDGWTQAHIWRESGGNAHAYRVEKDKLGNPLYDKTGRIVTGVGLGQITDRGLKRGHTDAELFDPRLNLTLSIGYLAYLGKLYGWDFARVSAAYNAGSVRASTLNRWGMVQTHGHVDAEVAAYNTWLSMKMTEEKRAAALAFAHQFSLFDLVPPREPLDTLPDPEADKEPA